MSIFARDRLGNSLAPRVVLFIALCGGLTALSSKEAVAGEAPRQATRAWFDLGLGAAAGMSSGFGPNLRLDFGPRWGSSLVVLVAPHEKEPALSVGASIRRVFWHRDSIRAYALAGVHYFGRELRFDKPFAGQKNYAELEILALGVGPGVEARLGPLAFIFELPFVVVRALNASTDLRFPGRVNYGLYPSVAICLYFRSLARWHKG